MRILHFFFKVILVTVFLPLRLSAADLSFDAKYDVYWKGLRVFTAEAQTAIANERYESGMQFWPVGLLALWVDGRSEVNASGFIRPDGAVNAQHYRVEGKWDGDKSYREIRFDNAGSVTDIKLALPEEWTADDPRLPIPDGVAIGPDPLSMLMAIVKQPWKRDDYTKPFDITFIDGRTVSRFTMKCDFDLDRMKSKEGRTDYNGEATRCTAKIKLIGGFVDESKLSNKALKKLEKRRAKVEKKRAKPKKEDSLQIWFQYFVAEDLMMPVRAKLRTDRGKVTVYLAKFSSK